MKVFKIKANREKDGFYKFPKNLTNRDMFCYPYLGDTEHQEEQRKLVNTIVLSFCESYKHVSIGMMGHDMMIVFTYNDEIESVEHNVRFGNYKIFKNKLIYFDNIDDYYKAMRFEKLETLLGND